VTKILRVNYDTTSPILIRSDHWHFMQQTDTHLTASFPGQPG